MSPNLVLSSFRVAALLWIALPSQAVELIAPVHYKTTDGVEVIVGRERAVVAVVASGPGTGAVSTVASGAVRARQPVAAAPSALAGAGAYRVSQTDQALRDKERVTILTSELVEEGRALEKNRLALRSPRAAIDLDSEQLEALRASAERHEGNIRALNDELRRAKNAGERVQRVALP